jgi:carbon storage regulator
MLVLSRQKDESIIIGDSVEIMVVDIRGDKVRVGTNAPATWAVYRKELYDQIQRQLRNKELPADFKLSRADPKSHGQLVLSRQKDETIYLVAADGRVVEITVVDIRGDKVRLGVTAPRDLSVHRKEVYEAIAREARAAAAQRPAG